MLIETRGMLFLTFLRKIAVIDRRWGGKFGVRMIRTVWEEQVLDCFTIDKIMVANTREEFEWQGGAGKKMG